MILTMTDCALHRTGAVWNVAGCPPGVRSELASWWPMGTHGPGDLSLTAVRRAIGDEAFTAAIEDLSGTAGDRVITIDDVVEALEARSGRRLTGLRHGLGLAVQD
jgi:hypothetical protein